MAKRYGSEQIQLPEVWQIFSRPDWPVVPGDPQGPVAARDLPDDVNVAHRNDIRSRTFRVGKFDFVFTLQSNDTKYSLNWAIWPKNSNNATSVLISGHDANPDRLQEEIRKAIQLRNDLKDLYELAWYFEIVWTTKEKHIDFTGVAVKVGDYIIYAANGGRSAILKYGRVTKLTYSGRGGYNSAAADCAVQAVTLDNWGRPITLTFMSRIVVVQSIPHPFRGRLDEAWYTAMEKK